MSLLYSWSLYNLSSFCYWSSYSWSLLYPRFSLCSWSLFYSLSLLYSWSLFYSWSSLSSPLTPLVQVVLTLGFMLVAFQMRVEGSYFLLFLLTLLQVAKHNKTILIQNLSCMVWNLVFDLKTNQISNIKLYISLGRSWHHHRADHLHGVHHPAGRHTDSTGHLLP